MNELEIKHMELTVKKAEVSIAELEYKILEREQDIQRCRDHIILQQNLIRETSEKLEKAKGK